MKSMGVHIVGCLLTCVPIVVFIVMWFTGSNWDLASIALVSMGVTITGMGIYFIRDTTSCLMKTCDSLFVLSGLLLILTVLVEWLKIDHLLAVKLGITATVMFVLACASLGIAYRVIYRDGF